MGGIMPFLPLDQPSDCLTCKEEVMVEQSDGFVCSQCGRILGDIDESSDNDPVPGPIKTRSRQRSENDSNSDRDDSKRQAVAADSSDDMLLDTSKISPQTSSSFDSTATTTDTAETIAAADTNQDLIIKQTHFRQADNAERLRAQSELDSLKSLIPQLEARKASLEALLSSPEVAAVSPSSAPVQPQPAMQTEPAMQPEPTTSKQSDPAMPQQADTTAGLNASTALPAQPRTLHPPKRPRVAAPRASFAAMAAGAAAGAAAAAAVAGAYAPKPPRKTFSPATSGREQQQAAPPSSFAATYHVRNKFVFKAPPGILPDSAASLKDRLKSLLEVRLPGANLPIADAVLFGSQATSTRVFFTLGSLEAADELVRRRSALKGSGASIQDFLTPEELKIKRALWPRFMEARARGQRAQFHRAKLVVSS